MSRASNHASQRIPLFNNSLALDAHKIKWKLARSKSFVAQGLDEFVKHFPSCKL
jgi:hypothetical protein